MEFDVVITQEPDASWRAVTAALPNCEVNVGTELLRRIAADGG